MGMGFDFKCDFASPTILLGLFLSFGCGIFGISLVSYFGGIQHSPVDGCSAASNFRALTGDGERTSSYFAILGECIIFLDNFFL